MNSLRFSKLQSAYRRSGLSARAFCRKHRIAYGTFLYWSRKAARPTPSPAPMAPTFVELVPSTPTVATDAPILCTLGNVTLALPAPRTLEAWRTLFQAAREAFQC